MKPRIVSDLALVVTGALACASVLGQDGIPSLSANWRSMPDGGAATGRVVALAERALTEHGEALMSVFDPADDPAARCEHPGAVRVILSPYPIGFEIHADHVSINYEEWATTRTIHLTPQEADPDLPHRLMGVSVGRFENGRLVIETDSLAMGLSMSTGYLWTSEEATLHEEYYLVEGDAVLMLRMTLTDPVMLTQPWAVEKRWERYDGELRDFDCAATPE